MHLHLLRQPMSAMLPVARPRPVLSAIMLQAITIVAGQEQITKALASLVVAPPSSATEQAGLLQPQPLFALR